MTNPLASAAYAAMDANRSHCCPRSYVQRAKLLVPSEKRSRDTHVSSGPEFLAQKTGFLLLLLADPLLRLLSVPTLEELAHLFELIGLLLGTVHLGVDFGRHHVVLFVCVFARFAWLPSSPKASLGICSASSSSRIA